jgi:FMN phosphatase YigB (HAD superfamily)
MSQEHQEGPLSAAPIKALVFDLMGTCLDWYSSVNPVLKDALLSSGGEEQGTTLFWRQSFFREIHKRFEASLPQEDIDETHRRTLLAILQAKGLTVEADKVEACVRAWHSQKGRFDAD